MSTVPAASARGLNRRWAYAEGTADGEAPIASISLNRIDVKAIRRQAGNDDKSEFAGRLTVSRSIPCAIGTQGFAPAGRTD